MDEEHGARAFAAAVGLVVGAALWAIAFVVHRRRRKLFKLAWAELLHGSPVNALRLADRLDRLKTTIDRHLADQVRSVARAVLPESAGGKPGAPCEWPLRPSMLWEFINMSVIRAVTEGWYAEALSMEDPWPETVKLEGQLLSSEPFLLARINRAEALHNMGRDQEALELLASVEGDVGDYELGKSGLLCLRAWILVRVGNLEEARRALEALDPAPLVPNYAPELAYTWAALERECGNAPGALAASTLGLSFATGPSSVRNGHVSVASAMAAGGDFAGALAEFERAAGQPYTGQAGDGLLRHGALLEQLGNIEGALRAYELALERDPQSVFAEDARRRCAQLCGKRSR